MDADIDIVSAFEAVGKYNQGLIDDEELYAIECHACPGPGSCGGMYTANTMAAAIEALGMSLPGSSSNPAESRGEAQRRGSGGRGAAQFVGERHHAAGHYDEGGI